MCGIAGYLGHPVPGLSERMASLVAHRGPDDAGNELFAGADGQVAALLSRDPAARVGPRIF